MPQLVLRNISLGFGADPLLDDVNLTIEPGERLCLVGRNGAGKSTLFRILSGEMQPDDGQIEMSQGLTIARLVQEVPRDLAGTVAEVVAGGHGEVLALLREYDRLGATLDGSDDRELARFAALQADIEAADGWALQQRVETVLSRLGLDGTADFPRLSGGMKRRVMLARALVQSPDILLLDEPTNHLDVESIQWLEEYFRGWPGTLVFITHDRAFIRALATRIIELDRGRLTSWPGDYERFLRGRQQLLDAEQAANAEFDKRLSREERWIRQGIKARRTRNEGRVRALQEMRRERARRRERVGRAEIQLQEATRSGNLVIEAEHITHGHGGRTLIRDFGIRIFRGDRIGIIGPNGSGKSTLLNLLLGRVTPDAGRVTLGTGLQIAWFDQLRETLDENATVMANLVEGSDFVTVDGKPKHAVGYLQEFLFSPDRIRQPVSALSGGERARLLLARLFSRSFNLLVMDEPTNDLDAETLELLEERLMAWQGTLLLVSHDREFLDNVVTSTIAFEHGEVNEYVGGYQDWLRQRRPPPEPAGSGRKETPPVAPARRAAEPPPAQRRRLSYREQEELKALPGRIEQLEREMADTEQALSDPALFRDDPPRARRLSERLAELERELEAAFARWQELE